MDMIKKAIIILVKVFLLLFGILFVLISLVAKLQNEEISLIIVCSFK